MPDGTIIDPKATRPAPTVPPSPGRGIGFQPEALTGRPIPVTPVTPQGEPLPSSIEPVETADTAFSRWVGRGIEGVGEGGIEKRPPATQEESELQSLKDEITNALEFYSTLLSESPLSDLQKLSRKFLDPQNRITQLGREAGAGQIGPVPQLDRPPASVPQLDLPKIPEIPGILPDEAEGLTSALTALGTAAQGAAQAVEPLPPALNATATAAQTMQDALPTPEEVPPLVPDDMVQELQAVAQEFEQVPSTIQSTVSDVNSEFNFAQAEQAVASFVQTVNDSMSRLRAKGGGGTEGAATGGLITGPGTETSDSIPILASVNEFMMQARAVRHYGTGFMHAVNSMEFPRLSMGGLIDHLNTPLSGQIRLPRFSDGGPITSSGSSGVPVHVNFEGRRVFSASAPRSSIEQLKRESLLQKVRSGGPSPFWVE